MNTEETFNLITKSFSKVFDNFSVLKITKELDWERHLYVEIKKNIGEQVFNRYIIYLETGVLKHGNGFLWISPNTFLKKKELICEFFDIEKDEGGHYKLNLSKNIKPLSAPIKKFIDTEKERWYYIDIVIYDKNINRPLAYIELKCENNLSDGIVLQDFYKLKRLESVRNFPAIFIAAGFDPLNNKIFWMPTNPLYNFTFKITSTPASVYYSNCPASFLNANEMLSIIKNVTKTLYETTHATEALWSAEIMFALQPYLPKDWHMNSEISLKEDSGRVDLGISNPNFELHTAIEIKNHYEAPFPSELLNGLYNDTNLQKDFFNQVGEFLSKFNDDKSILRTRSAFPKNNNGYYLNADFFEKIIEIYAQYKRMSQLIRSKKLTQGFMVYIDHNDDYSIRKKTHNIPEEVFLNNFQFRKSLILKILDAVKEDNCHFIYSDKLNTKNDIKKLFFT